MGLPKLILASRSPRRRELLAEAGYEFEVRPPRSADECGVCSRESPAELVARLAFEKAADVVQQIERVPASSCDTVAERDSQTSSLNPQASLLVLACDTVAECDGEVLGKPANETEARRMLDKLSGRAHRVLSGVCLWRVPGNRLLTRVAVSKLTMDRLSERQLDEYVESCQWEGKAGGFGYQDRLGWVHIVAGSESNVVGLPMELLSAMISEVIAELGDTTATLESPR
jgi:septum formation protein